MPFAPTARPLNSMHAERVAFASAIADRLDDLGPIAVRLDSGRTKALSIADTYVFVLDVAGTPAEARIPAWALMHASKTAECLDAIELRIRHTAFYSRLTAALARHSRPA